jgi:hypothetical protein
MAKMAILLIVAFLLRLYGVDWDQWGQLHPDERMLMMVADKIHFFKNLDPDFFNYGSLPVYLLRLFHPSNDYYTLVKTGRYLSIFFDLVTVLFVYKIATNLFKNNAIALAAGFFYAIAFFPIQNSHFFVVDVLLTTLTTILLYKLLLFFKKPSVKSVIIIGVVLAAMMATKFTAIVFLPFTAGVIIWKEFRNLKKLFIYLPVFGVVFLTFFFVFMPYAFIDYQRFVTDITSQLKMNSNPYTFPYTLQYAGTLPYLYYLKNIFFWGLGPVISAISIIGLVNSKKYFKNAGYLIFITFLLYYFLLVGRSSVKFMRYMLPIYPLLTVLSGYGLSRIKEINKYIALILVMASVVWSTAFVNIYSYTHTRIAATDWIKKNIPEGKTLAVEHWDDRLPVGDSGSYKFEELTLYDQPDDEYKWNTINDKLDRSDYIIIASNRLYTPLSKLTDCNKYKVCFGMTAEYYKKLFGNRLPFRKVAEFQAYPGFKIGKYNFGINDQSADESFTVYDHPKIIIYKKLH